MAAIMANDIDSEDLIRHMLLNSILHIKGKFREYGQVIICCDGAESWRKRIFPHYKARRHKKHKADKNWPVITSTIDKFWRELDINSPYPVLRIENAEGDDIIGVLVRKAEGRKMIVSGDKDFRQLHNAQVQQYNPISKEMVTCENPDLFLKEMLIQGDDGDDIPNIFSDNDTFVVAEKKQTPVKKKNLPAWVRISPDRFCDAKALARYEENRHLIDLSLIPYDVVESITAQYQEKTAHIKKSNMFNYLMQNKLTKLLADVQDF